ncbi:MAG: hypothetical protein ACRC28_10550 [Clostridium sp.]|uniref:hypothetical protein n=1 Tax=Clostridium sp. TaxID=1506 RepID=UPI003F2F552C
MKNKKILSIGVVAIVIVLGIIFYISMENKNNHKVKNSQIINQEQEVFNKNIGNSTKGQLLENSDISKSIFEGLKYSGISNESITKEVTFGITKEPVKIIIKKYNPNVLTQKTLVNYYNEQIKNNSNNGEEVEYILLDVYNNSFGIIMNNQENKFNEFSVGNINEKFEIVDNKNSMYCGIKSNGEITSYSSYGNNTGKEELFILKK